MATLIVEVEDKKLKFFKELLRSFSFVKVREKALDEDTDEQVVANIRQGIEELRLVEKGKTKTTTFKDFLKELDEV